MTPQRRYERLLAQAGFVADPAQATVVSRLDAIHARLLAQPGQPRRRIGAWLRRAASPPAAVRGLYLWGSVGRGKTFIVDAFYDCLPARIGKRRLHFHTFMRAVHAALRELRDTADPLAEVARRWAPELRVLCLDEFHVGDITDAMLLARLLEALFERGLTLVTTSNEAPDNLYRGGLQRARFLPAIALLKEHLEVLHLTGAQDYRLRTLTRAATYYTPADTVAEAALAAQFAALSTPDTRRVAPLDLEGRTVTLREQAEGVVWFDFATLCGGPRSTGDYIEIARCFHTVFLSGVPMLGPDADDAARRFINLVDELYDRNVNLLLSAAAAPTALYWGSRLAEAFRRTASRLQEMQSEEYLGQPHLSD